MTGFIYHLSQLDLVILGVVQHPKIDKTMQ